MSLPLWLSVSGNRGRDDVRAVGLMLFIHSAVSDFLSVSFLVFSSAAEASTEKVQTRVGQPGDHAA